MSGVECFITGTADDDTRAAGEGFSKVAEDRFKRFAPHDDRVPHSQGFEVFEVFGEVPWHFIIFTDAVVLRHGNDEGNGYVAVDIRQNVIPLASIF